MGAFNESNPKFTVVIPTRCRPDTLEYALRSVTSQNYDRLEVIVSDNFSCDATEDVVRNAKDDRIRYVNTGKRVSMAHNYEFGVSHITDGWVTILGDDDALLPRALEKVANAVSASNAKALRSALCYYHWPAGPGDYSRFFGIRLSSGYELRRSSEWLQNVMQGRCSYTELPVLYTGGFASIDVLRQLNVDNLGVFRSQCPDVYSGMAIASVLDKYVYSYEPLAISGTSKHSTGAAWANNIAASADSSLTRFLSEPNIPIHHDLPLADNGSLPQSKQVVAYESYLQSKFLRGDNPEVTHAKQLEIILEAGPIDPTSESQIELLVGWAKRFAELHGLQMPNTKLPSTPKERSKTPVNSRDRVYRIGGQRLRNARNVYDAAVVVDNISRNPFLRNKLHLSHCYHTMKDKARKVAKDLSGFLSGRAKNVTNDKQAGCEQTS